MKILLLFILSITFCTANTDDRTWQFINGEKLRAELVSYDPESGDVELLIQDKETVTHPYANFSNIDKAWLITWSEFLEENQRLLESLGGVTEHWIHEQTFETDLFIYYPKQLNEPDSDIKLPGLILFHPGGKASRNLLRHMEAAEEAGMILISCGQFRNTGDDQEKEAEFLQRFKEIFPSIIEIPSLDHDKIFMGGTSGGAWKAYHYSAWVDWNWAGIYANGGWLGDEKYHDLPYCKNMRVAIVNGNNDHANRVVDHDSAILLKHNCKIGLISFEGAHQMSPTKSQVKAFKWLIDSEAFIEDIE